MAGHKLKNRDNGPRSTAKTQLVRLAALISLLFPLAPARATDRHWDGSNDTAWNKKQNWSNNNQPGFNDNAVFDGIFLNQPGLTRNETVGGIWMSGNTVPNLTISSSSDVLTLNGNTINGIPNLGLLVDNSNGSKFTITTDLRIGNAQTWLNNSNNVVTIAGGVDLNSTGLTIGGTGNFQVGGVISTSGLLPDNDSITLTGTGVRAFTGANTYNGLTIVSGGTLIIQNSSGLGSTAAGTSVASGAQLQIQSVSGLTISTEALTLNGSGIAGGVGPTDAGALRNVAGNNSFGGQITLGSDSTIISGGDTLTLSGGIVTGGFTVTFGGDSTISTSGAINGTGALIKIDPGTLILNGANGYSGGTTINGGTVVIANNASLGASTGSATINAATLEAVSTFTSSRNYVLGSATSTITVDPAATLTATGVFSGTGTLNKNGTGTMVLGGANTFTGATKVNAGNLTLAASSGSALGTTSSITVNSSGTVALGANNQINNTAPMTLAGGTFAKGNFNEGSASTPGVGALTLTAAGSHIDFGTGTVGVLTFASFTPGAFTLTVDNWTGTPNMAGSVSTDRLIFNSNQSANLGAFVFTGFGGPVTEFDLGNGFFEVTPVPEPSTWLAAAIAAGVAGMFVLRRRQPEGFASLAPRNLVLVICGLPLLVGTASATPREDIIRAVANSTSDFSQAAPREFLRAFTAVALRVEPEDLPAYLTAAINLRPDLAPNSVAMSLKIAAKNSGEKARTLGPMIDGIMRAAITAKPDAVVTITEAGASALPQYRSDVVSAAIAAAPKAEEAIIRAAGTKTIPFAFLTFSASGTSGFSYRSEGLNPLNTSDNGNVASPEQPPP